MRGTVEQALANRLKVTRALTRLKHSIAADDELNVALDAAKKRFTKKVHEGKLPAAVNLDALTKALDVV